MNHKRSSLLSEWYVALTKAFEPGNARDSTILPAPLVDGCLRNTIVARERAGTHHSAPRARRIGRCTALSASITTRNALQRTCSSPAAQFISSREVVSTCTCWPVAASMFSDRAVRALLWKGAGRGAWELGGLCAVFMVASPIFLLAQGRQVASKQLSRCGARISSTSKFSPGPAIVSSSALGASAGSFDPTRITA